MALTIDTQDLENYPGITKTVTIDNEKLVPVGYDGDEQFSLSYSTSAYSDNEDFTAVQDLYITDLKVGWHKSSGFAGSSGKFALDATHNSFKLKLDTTISGSDGNGYYTVTLDYNENLTPVTGESIANDMEEKIRNLSLVTGDTGYALAYRNSTVTFSENKFWVFSGTMGRYYTGTSRSSVDIKSASSDDCLTVLGFDIGWKSEDLDELAVREALVTQNYIFGETELYIQAGTSFSDGDCMYITDGTNSDYFVVASGTNDTTVHLTASGSVGSITNSYTANMAKIQIMKQQDPDGGPKMYYDSVDKINRHGLELIMSQIDYSS